MRDTHQYRQLLREFANATQLADPERFIATGLVQVDDMTMLLHYDEKRMPDKMLLRMDLGPITGDKERIWFTLLASNFILGELGVYVFSLNPEAGNIILTLQLPIDETMTGQGLIGCLQTAVQEGKRCWEQVRAMLDHPGNNVIELPFARAGGIRA